MRELLAFIDHLRGDLSEASAALERNDMEAALEKFGAVALRIQSKVAELRR